MKNPWLYFFLITIFAVIFALGKSGVNAQVTSTTPAPASQPQPTSTPNFINPFNYTPLPATSSPQNDIIESQPLTESRPSAQVDDYITFSVTIQNRAPYNKQLQNVCFESTDGNFGCQWGISLAPGQSFTLNNVGTWTIGGTKDVWITWSQDGQNYYQPLNANHIKVNIIG